MRYLSEYILSLKEKGEFCFTSEQALSALKISKEALRMSLVRLRRKKEIVTLSKTFHLIIPAENRIIGCMQADYFISAYMKFLQLPYYVCLLSAANYYGAAHQKPQVFQVMTNKQLNPIKCGKVAIQFYFKKTIENIPINTLSVPTGYIKVSTPEIVAMDMLHYIKPAGGLNHIATVFTELIESINPEKLLELAVNSDELAWVQRLGYILQHVDPISTENRDTAANLLKDFINKKKPAYILLSNSREAKSNENVKNNDWRIIVNTPIESDI